MDVNQFEDSNVRQAGARQTIVQYNQSGSPTRTLALFTVYLCTCAVQGPGSVQYPSDVEYLPTVATSIASSSFLSASGGSGP